METATLICLPFAGGGASFFRKWQQRTPDELHVLPVQLPGREERFLAPPHTDVAEAMDEAWSWALSRLDTHTGKVAVFGQSLGAILAFELTHRLTERSGLCISRLFVSGAAGPRTPRRNWTTDVDDYAFPARVNDITGYTHPTLDDPEMTALLLPALRADFAMNGTYQPTPRTPLNTPITAVRGNNDHMVSATQTTLCGPPRPLHSAPAANSSEAICTSLTPLTPCSNCSRTN